MEPIELLEAQAEADRQLRDAETLGETGDVFGLP